MNSRPAFQFYPRDWLSDLDLQGCSLPAQAIMISYICVTHDSPQYGVLCIAGEKRDPFSDHKFAKKCSKIFRITPKKFQKLLRELVDANVLKQDDEGWIYCARMLRDQALSDMRSAAGKRGGNPNLVKQKVHQSSKQNLTPSTTSSFSPSLKTPPTTPPPESEGKSGDVSGELSDEQKEYIILATKHRAREESKIGYARTLTRRAKAGELNIEDLDNLRKLEKIENEKDEIAERSRKTAERLGIAQ